MATAIRSLRTGELAAKSPTNIVEDLGFALERLAESDTYGQINSFLSIGAEDILKNHPAKHVRELIEPLRQHYDTKQALEASLLEGLNKAMNGRTINEKNEAVQQFEEYIRIRESNQNFAKAFGSGSHSEVSLANAQEFYDNTMSETAKALVDWAQVTAEMTGQINEQLDVHVRDKAGGEGKGGKWRPIGNLGSLHFPRMLTSKTARIIYDAYEADGITYKPEYQQLLMDMVENGNADSMEEAHQRLSKDGGVNFIQSNEFLEGVEIARGIKLPEVNGATGESYYDTSIAAYVNFLTRYADRIAQIQSFGQSRDGTMTTVWDKWMRDTTGDLKMEVARIKDAVEGVRDYSPVTNWLLSGASLSLLGSPLGSLRNFYTGVFFTGEQVGVGIGAKATAQVGWAYGKSLVNALVEFHKKRKKALEGEGKVWYLSTDLKGGEWSYTDPEMLSRAEDAGAVQRDIINSMILDLGEESVWNDETTVSGFLKKVNRKTLFLHQVAERMARTTNYAAAVSFLGTHGESIIKQEGRWKQHVAMLKRMGLTDEDIMAAIEEKPWAVAKVARKMVREKQYSYDVTQTPLMFHGRASNTWKLMFQFQRWGFQRARDISRNIIFPFIGEERVTWQGKEIGTGTSMTGKPVVRDILPLVRMLLLAVGSGALYGVLREFLKNKGRREAEWTHIFATANSDQDRALMMAAERIAMDFANSGSLGIAADYAQYARDAVTRGLRARSPFEPPSFAVARDISEVLSRRFQRGGAGLTVEGLADDVMYTLNKFPTFQQTGVIGTRIGLLPALDSVPVLEKLIRDDPHTRMKNVRQVQRLRGLMADYSTEMDLNFSSGGSTSLNENTFEYKTMREALNAGDAKTALKIRRKLLDESDDKKKTLQGLKQSVRSSQPLNAYGVKSDIERRRFVKWLRSRLGSAEANELLEVQRRYDRTAKRAGVRD